MNLGIVIGVSRYDAVSDLPGCLNDANAMHQLLQLSGKCDDILFIIDNTNSKSIKARLTAFVSKYEKGSIEEVIFYYTGHGLFESDEFFYILSDYDSTKKNQTSLNNSELDSLLRSLSAQLTIKIVDACQSGTRYVKDVDSFQKYLRNSEKSFNRCYFYYSSQNDQSSYQNNKISDFTLEIINAFINRPNQEIRYKDISDSLADAFATNLRQKPFFIMQGNYTEIFGNISADVCLALEQIVGQREKEERALTVEPKSLMALVQENAKLYCAEEEAIQCVVDIAILVEGYKFTDELMEMYTPNVERVSDTSAPIKTDYIGEYLSKSDNNYFVRILKETRTKKVPQNNFLLATQAIFGEDVRMVDKEYQATSGAKSTVKLPFSYIFIRCDAKYPNINDAGCIIFPFLSKTKIAILAVHFHYRSREWTVKEVVQSSCMWFAYEEYIKEDHKIKKIIEDILDEYEYSIIHPIKEELGLVDKSQE